MMQGSSKAEFFGRRGHRLRLRHLQANARFEKHVQSRLEGFFPFAQGCKLGSNGSFGEGLLELGPCPILSRCTFLAFSLIELLLELVERVSGTWKGLLRVPKSPRYESTRTRRGWVLRGPS